MKESGEIIDSDGLIYYSDILELLAIDSYFYKFTEKTDCCAYKGYINKDSIDKFISNNHLEISEFVNSSVNKLWFNNEIFIWYFKIGKNRETYEIVGPRETLKKINPEKVFEEYHFFNPLISKDERQWSEEFH